MSVIKQQDIIDSIADACQYISYFHPEDFVTAMVEAYENEKSEAAKNAIGQILIFIFPKVFSFYLLLVVFCVNFNN